jgi:hypothetical protein
MPNKKVSQRKQQTRKRKTKSVGLTVASRKLRNSRPRAIISHCSRDYLHALLDPFDGPLACVPTAPSIESLKIRTWVKGVFTIGTAGFGFIEMSPIDMAAQDANPVQRSGVAFANTIMNGGPGSVTAQSNSPYFSSDFADPETAPLANEARVVAAGIRVRYTGTELNKGGVIYPWHHRNNGSLDTMGITDYLSFQGNSTAETNRKWTSVVWTPVGTRDTRFGYNIGAPYGPYSLAVMATGVPGNTFEYEAVAVLEITGQTIRSLTPSHADPPGFQGIQEMQSKDHGVFSPYVGDVGNRIAAAAQGLSDYLATGISYASSASRAYTAVKQMTDQYSTLSID